MGDPCPWSGLNPINHYDSHLLQCAHLFDNVHVSLHISILGFRTFLLAVHTHLPLARILQDMQPSMHRQLYGEEMGLSLQELQCPNNSIILFE